MITIIIILLSPPSFSLIVYIVFMGEGSSCHLVNSFQEAYMKDYGEKQKVLAIQDDKTNWGGGVTPQLVLFEGLSNLPSSMH